MPNLKVLSSDSHIVEPPDLWTSRIDPAFQDRAPHMIIDDEGMARWLVEGDQSLGSVGAPSQAGLRYEDPEAITFEGALDDVRPGAFEPGPRTEDMRIDGVDGEVIYPTVGARLYTILEPNLLAACFRASNDWLADFCSANPGLFKGNALISLDDVEDGIRELERCAKLGYRGAMITTYPGDDKQYEHPDYEPFWSAAESLGVVISMHIASNRPGPGQVSVFTVNGDEEGAAAFSVNQDHWVRKSVASMIFSGVFERHPNLNVAIVEHELAWAPYFLRTMDWLYTELSQTAPHRFKEGVLPSDYFRSNVTMSFQQDDIGIQLRHLIGVQCLTWGSDYPHAESTWPKSREVLAKVLADVPADEQRKIVCDNVAGLFGFA